MVLKTKCTVYLHDKYVKYISATLSLTHLVLSPPE